MFEWHSSSKLCLHPFVNLIITDKFLDPEVVNRDNEPARTTVKVSKLNFVTKIYTQPSFEIKFCCINSAVLIPANVIFEPRVPHVSAGLVKTLNPFLINTALSFHFHVRQVS